MEVVSRFVLFNEARIYTLFDVEFNLVDWILGCTVGAAPQY